MPELDRLYYTLGIETTDFEQGIAKAESNFSKLTQSVASMAATLGISLGLKNVIKDVQSLTMSFDYATRQIWTLLDITEEEFKSLQQSIIELSKQGVYSAEQIANAMYQAVSSGIEAGDAISFVSEAMKAAQAGASDLFTVVDGLTTVMNAWGYSAEEVSRINDILFLGVDKGKTTFEELSSSIGLVAPTASQAGVSLEEVISAIAAMTQQGLSTSRAVFSLNQAIMSIIAPSEQAKKIINELGIEFNETALKEQGFAAILNEAYEAANGNVEILTTLFGSVQALRAVLSLTGEGAENFTSILEQMETVAGKTDAAYEKMQGSLENTRKQMQNMFDAIKLEIGEALLPFLQWITKVGMAFADWIEQMSPAEKIIMGVTTALVALIPIMQTVNLLLSALKLGTGNWLGALLGIGAAVGASTIAIGTLNQYMKDAAEEAEKAKKALEGLSAAELQQLNENLSKSTVEAASLNEEVKNTAERYITLIELVRKYNDLQAINSIEAADVKSQIEEMLTMYPELNSSVYYTGVQYELQIGYLKLILEYELERINAQIELQKQQLSTAQSTEEINKRIAQIQEQLEVGKGAMEWYQYILDTSNLSKNVRKEVEDMYNVAASKVSELESELEALNDLTKNRAEAEKIVVDLQTKQMEIQEKIKNLTAESMRKQQIEQTKRQIEDLNAAVEEQIKTLEEITDKTSDSYAAQYEIVSRTVENMKKVINSYINAMIEQGEITEETRKMMLMLIDVDKRLETIKPEIIPTVQTIDIDAIRQNVELTRKIYETESVDIAKTFYQQTASEINKALIQAIRLGDENMISALRSYKENIDAIGEEINESIKTTISIDEDVIRTIEEDIKQKLSGLQRAIEAGEKDISKQMYTGLLNYISNALKQAYIENNQETIAMLKQYENEISKYAVSFVDTLSNSLTSEEIQNQLNLINQAMQLGLNDLANTLAGSLKQRINQALEDLLNVEDVEERINELKNVLSKIDEILTPDIVTDIQNDINMLKRAYEEGLTDFANTLETYISSTLLKQLYEAWKSGNDELYNEILRLQTMFEQMKIELKPIEITEIGININQIQKDFETLNLYIEKGYIELAHRLSPKLYQDIMKGLEQAIQEGNEEILQQMLAFKEQYEEIMQSLTVSAVPITDEIRNNLALLSKAYEEGLTDFADILKSSITRTLNEELFKAWQEGNQALYEELLSLRETYEMLQNTFEDEIITPDIVSDIQNDIEMLKRAYQEGLMDFANTLEAYVSSTLSKQLYEAWKNGNDELYNEILRLQTMFEQIQIELKPIEITEIGININQIQKDFETLNLYIEKGYIELAHRLSPKLYQDIMKGLEQAIQEGNEEILQQMLAFKEQYEEIMQSLTVSAVPITDEIRNNLALLSKAYEEGLTDFADILKSSITRTLNEELFKAWQEGNQALYEELLSLRETYEMLQNTFEIEEVKTTALEKSIQKIKANLELMNKYIEAGYTELAKNLSSTTYSDIMRAIALAIETGNYEIIDNLEGFKNEYYEILSSISVGYEDALEDIRTAVQKYQEAILLGQTDIAEQIKRDVESQIKSLKYDVFFEGNVEAMQAIEMVSQDWQNILEEIRTQELEPILLQISELETIANDVNKSFEERLNALEKIKQLQKDANFEESKLAITTQRINELEKERQRILEEEKETISEQADLMNSILSSIESALENMGEMGKLIATILKSVNFEVGEIIENGEVIGYKLVNPFEDIEKLTRDISVNIAQWGIEQIGIMFTNLIDDLKEAFATPSKWTSETLTSTAELFKNFNEYEKNLRKKQQLEAKQAAERIGGTAAGALIGGFFGGPLGALIGAGIGAAVGNAAAKTLEEQIAALDEKLLVSWQDIKEALGTDIDSIASALERAFDATTYDDFVNNFSTSLEDMTKQALIRAFLASEAMQPLLSALSDTISAAVVDGVLSASEKAAILKAQEDLLDMAGPFFEILEEMFKTAETETQLYGREYRPAAATITEATANRLEALLSTINLNVTRITNKMLYDVIRVEVTNIRAIAGISPDEYLKSIGV